MSVCVGDLIEELELMKPVYLTEEQYFDNVPDPAWNVIQNIFDRIPNIYEDDMEWLDVEIATNGDELLFKHENDCERFADVLDEHVFGYTECHIGYYDPKEDERSGEVDGNTGWYYIDFD